jgi:hypothetical protein
MRIDSEVAGGMPGEGPEYSEHEDSAESEKLKDSEVGGFSLFPMVRGSVVHPAVTRIESPKVPSALR